MPQDHPRVWMTVEDTAVDQPHHMPSGRRRPAPSRTDEFGVILDDPPVDRGGAWMDVQRNVEVLQRHPKRVELGLVEVMAQRVVVDERTAQAKADGPAEFLNCRRHVLKRQRRESRKPRGMLGNHLQQLVVCLARIALGNLDVRLHLDPRTGQREHLDIHAGTIHLREPVLGEIGEPATEVLESISPHRRTDVCEGPRCLQVMHPKGFLKRDQSWHWSLRVVHVTHTHRYLQWSWCSFEPERSEGADDGCASTLATGWMSRHHNLWTIPARSRRSSSATTRA
jgi:hypothetical protein